MIILIILVLIVNIITFVVPKKRTKIELFTVGMFAILYATLTDIILTDIYLLYFYFTPDAIWLWFIPLFGFKAQMAVLFINYFPLFSRFSGKIIYIFWWSVFSVSFEWGTVYVGNLHYNGWNIWFSALAYPIILTVIALFFFYVRYLMRNNKWFKKG